MKIDKMNQLVEESVQEMVRKLNRLGVPITAVSITTNKLKPHYNIDLKLTIRKDWFFDKKGGAECED